MKTRQKILALALPLTLTLTFAACSNSEPTAEPSPTPTVEVVEPAPAETPEPADNTPTSVLTEDEALEALASISSQATSQQWRSIAQGVCDEYETQAKPVDELGETSQNVIDKIRSTPLFQGTGEVAASFPGDQLQPGQSGMLLLGSTELACPKWTDDALVYVQTELPSSE